MATLTQKVRNSIPTSKFAGPGRSYPIPDANHARAALSMLHNAPASEQPAIRAKVHAAYPSIDAVPHIVAALRRQG